jgi:hypothetical protein
MSQTMTETTNETGKEDWKSFFWIKLPIAVILVAGCVQIVAMLLANVPMRRFETDGFPEAVALDKSDHKVILFGDSITRNATRYFNVGDEATVLNLSNHLLFGLAGDVMLLQRYLETHKSPAFVEIVATPTLFAGPPDISRVHYYLWRIFSRPQEHDYLRSLFPGIDSREHYPAIFDIQQRIVEPLLSLIQGGRGHYYALGRDPDPHAPLEPASTDLSDEKSIRARIEAPMRLLPPYAAALKDLCALSRQYGFRLDIVWAPGPKRAVAAWREAHEIETLQSDILAAIGDGCAPPNFTDFNDGIDYLSFDHGATHLRGEGWDQLFASKMHLRIQQLLEARQAPQ